MNIIYKEVIPNKCILKICKNDDNQILDLEKKEIRSNESTIRNTGVKNAKS